MNKLAVLASAAVVLAPLMAMAQSSPVGPAASVELVVVGGDNPTKDNMHTQRGPGESVDVEYRVRDRNGNVLPLDQANAECEPTIVCDPMGDDAVVHAIPTLASPKGEMIATCLQGADRIIFGTAKGTFSAKAVCRRNPNIPQVGDPLNFENTAPLVSSPAPRGQPLQGETGQAGGPGMQGRGAASVAPGLPAPYPPPPMPPPAHHVNTALFAVLIVLAIAGVVVAVSASAASSSQYCYTSTSNPGGCGNGEVCDSTQAQCESDMNQYISICSCHVGCTGFDQPTFAAGACSGSSRTAPPRSVNELVAHGLVAQEAVRAPTIPAMPRQPVALTAQARYGSSALGPTAQLPRARASTATAHSDLAHAMTIGVASLLSRTWQRLGPATGLELNPWVDATSGGLVVGSHF